MQAQSGTHATGIGPQVFLQYADSLISQMPRLWDGVPRIALTAAFLYAVLPHPDCIVGFLAG
jgi:hypothetical protein